MANTPKTTAWHPEQVIQVLDLLNDSGVQFYQVGNWPQLYTIAGDPPTQSYQPLTPAEAREWAERRING